MVNMKIEDIVVRDVIKASPNEKLSKVLSEMTAKKIHQVPVVEGEIFLGMLFLKDIVMEDIDPSSASVKAFMRKDVPRILPSSTENDAAKTMINSGVRALPVMNGEKLLGIISETELLGLVIASGTAEQLMSKPLLINENDSIGKAKQIMREHNISRLPVTDENGGLVGVIDTLDLAKTIKPPEKQVLSKGKAIYGETLQTSKVAISSIMRPAIAFARNSGISEIIQALKDNEEIILAEGNKPVGIISPKDVIELMLSKNSACQIQISGLDRDDEISRNSICEPIEKWIKKTGTRVDYIFLYVHKRSSSGRVKYSLHMRMRTQLGFFVMKSDGWNLLSCAQELAKKAESMTEKRHGLIMDRKKKRGKFRGR